MMEQVAAADECFSVAAEETVVHSEEVVTSTDQVVAPPPAASVDSDQPQSQPQAPAQPLAQPVNYIPTIIASTAGPVMQVVTLQTVQQPSTPQAGLTNALRNIRLIAIQPRLQVNGVNGRVQPIALQPSQKPGIKVQSQALEGNEARKVAVNNFYSKLKASPVLLAPKKTPQQVVQAKPEHPPASKTSPAIRKQQQSYVKPSPSYYKEQQREREMKEFSHLSEELSRGLRILVDLTTSLHHSTTWPFMERVDPVKDGAPDYEQIVAKPMWLSRIKEKFRNNEYPSIKEFVADMRLVVENCYRYNGPNHPVTKKALRLEQSFEQKLALLPTNLKEACALQETDEERKARPTSSEAFFSVLLHRVRDEREKRDQAVREKKAEELRLRREEKERQRALWAERMMNPQVKSQMSTMWEIPQLGHFLHLARGALHIGEIAQYELEHMFLMPEASALLATLMASLLSSPNQRVKLAESPPTPYSVWSARLNNRVAEWYRTYNREARQFVKVHELLGIEPMFWRICGDVNPLDGGKRYHQLSFLKRVWIFKGLCDTVAHSHKTVQEAMAEEEGPESRQVTLGTDSDGFTYLHFPAVSGSDIRVYRQKSWDVEQDPVWGPIVAERRIEEEERAREEERRAELLRRQRRAAAAAKRTPSRKPPAKKKPAARPPAQSTPTPQRKRSAPEERPLRLGTRVSPRTLQRQTGLATYKDTSSESENEEEKDDEAGEEAERSDDQESDNEQEGAKTDKAPEAKEVKEAAKKAVQRKRGRGGRRAKGRKRPVKKKLQKIEEEPEVDDEKSQAADESVVQKEEPADDEAASNEIKTEKDDVADMEVDQKPEADAQETGQVEVAEVKKEPVDEEVKKEDEEVKKEDEEVKKEDGEVKKEDGEVKKEDDEAKKEEQANETEQPATQRFTVSQLIKKISAEAPEEKMEVDEVDEVPLEKALTEDAPETKADESETKEEDEVENDPDPERSSYDPFFFELIISSVEQLQEWIDKFTDPPVNEDDDVDEEEEPRKPRARCEVKLRERLQALLDEAKPLAQDQQQANQKICQQLWKEWEQYRCASEKTASKGGDDADHPQEMELSDSEADGFPESLSDTDDENGPRKSRRLKVKRSQQANGSNSTRSSSPVEDEPSSKQPRKSNYGYDPGWDSDASAETPGRKRTNFVPEMKNPEYWIGRRLTRATAAFVEPDVSDASNPPGQPDDSSRSSSQADGAATPDKPTISPAKQEQLIDQLRQLRRQQAMLSSNDPRPADNSSSPSSANGSPNVSFRSKDGQSFVRISNPKAAELLSRIKTNRPANQPASPRAPAPSTPRKIVIQLKPSAQANGGSPAQPVSIDISHLIAQAAGKGMIVAEEPRSLAFDLGEHGSFLIKAQMTPAGPKVLSVTPIIRKPANPEGSVPVTEPVAQAPVAAETSSEPSNTLLNEEIQEPDQKLPESAETCSQSPEKSGTAEVEKSPAVPTKQLFINDPRQNNIISQDVLLAVAGPEALGAKLTVLKEGNAKVLTLILTNGEMRRLTTSQVQQIQAAVRNKTKAPADTASCASSTS